ncbi:hypothetical protein U0070_018955 [Myodes glareolus]|uniref:Uncharacterized protein n=1 Tax=Myodes glareolus TaxID=447135 RepID=A0AAW0H3H0_MYOGA
MTAGGGGGGEASGEPRPAVTSSRRRRRRHVARNGWRRRRRRPRGGGGDVIISRVPRVAGAEILGRGCDVTVVCRDLRDVEVTWDPAEHAGANLSLTWRYNREPRRPCPRYFLSGGLTSGCVLPARRLHSLEIDVRRGAESVFYRKGLASAFLKPRPPDDLALQWLEDAVRVTCPALSHPNLDYVIQHRGPGDSEWVASAPAPSCNVTVGGVDPSSCLDFRARASPREAFYGSDTQPSDWSRVTRWRPGDVTGARSWAVTSRLGTAWGRCPQLAKAWRAGPGRGRR